MSKIVKAGVGQRVAAIRAQLGISQHRLAMGALSPKASAKNIGRIEQGEVTPRLSTLSKIAFATDTDMSWLATGKAFVQDGRPIRVPGIGRRVQKSRLKKGLSQRAAAALLSASPSAKNVGRIEQSEVCPLPRTLRTLALGMGTTLSYLVNGR